MLFWICAAGLTAGVLWMLGQPLRRAAIDGIPGNAGEAEVYRDQLREIERDSARGLIDAEEAAAAKTDISRRLLASVRQGHCQTPGPRRDGPRHSRWPVRIAVGAVPILAVTLYLALGSWWLPGAPSRQADAFDRDRAGVDQLVAQVEARLREHPEDGRGWDVIAPVYLRLERHDEAAQAFSRAIRLLGEDVKRLQGFAEATILSRGGIVTEDARLAYEKVLALQPGRPEPRFWLALAKEQDGRLAEAATEYRGLIETASPGAAWRSAVRERLAAVEARLSQAGAATAKGPTPEDMATAANLSAPERSRMIAGMVEGLAARLAVDGQDLEGWQRLVRSYSVLGEKDKASEALERARKAFRGDSAALASLDEFARSLGLGS